MVGKRKSTFLVGFSSALALVFLWGSHDKDLGGIEKPQKRPEYREDLPQNNPEKHDLQIKGEKQATDLFNASLDEDFIPEEDDALNRNESLMARIQNERTAEKSAINRVFYESLDNSNTDSTSLAIAYRQVAQDDPDAFEYSSQGDDIPSSVFPFGDLHDIPPGFKK